MPYSVGQALEPLKTTELTQEALTNLVKSISIEASGAKTILYNAGA